MPLSTRLAGSDQGVGCQRVCAAELRVRRDEWTVYQTLRADIAKIIRGVKGEDWLPRGYSDADLRAELRRWAKIVKGQGNG